MVVEYTAKWNMDVEMHCMKVHVTFCHVHELCMEGCEMDYQFTYTRTCQHVYQYMAAGDLDDYPRYREGFFDDEQGFGSKECLEDTEMNCLRHYMQVGKWLLFFVQFPCLNPPTPYPEQDKLQMKGFLGWLRSMVVPFK